jgi:hypothetical protein
MVTAAGKEVGNYQAVFLDLFIFYPEIANLHPASHAREQMAGAAITCTGKNLLVFFYLHSLRKQIPYAA